MAHNQSTCLIGALPVDLSQQNICLAGFFCPNNTASQPPQFCPPTAQCQMTRLQTLWNTCGEPMGTYEPIACSPGFYCPEGGRQRLLCPSHYYCPLGSQSPLPCAPTSICPPGSIRQFQLLGVVIAVVVDISLALFILRSLVTRLFRQWRHSKRREYGFRSAHLLRSDEFHIPPPTGQPMSENNDPSLSQLCLFVQSIRKCIGSHDIGLRLDFDNLGYSVDGKSILQNISGTVKPGSLLAVMGPSGAGKLTFVRVLLGKVKNTLGTVLVNGNPRPLSDFKKVIGYVPQDDVVLPELTVEENLLYSARVRLPTTWKSAEIHEHVDKVIACLDLSDVRNSIVGDSINPVISGGQRKRVSIGLELAAAPLALVLDELTSGLDSTSALAIIKTLKALCHLGVTVICILHQPRVEIFESLDHLLLLSRGREVYFDQADKCMAYFRDIGFEAPPHYNPGDVIMDIVSSHGQKYSTNPQASIRDSIFKALASRIGPEKRKTRRATQRSLETEKNHQIELLFRSVSNRGAYWHRQIYYCFLRSIYQQSRQLKSFFLEIGVGAVAGLLIGLSVFRLEGLFFQGIFHKPFQLLSSAVNYTLVPELGLLCSTAIALAAAAPGTRTFGEEKAVYWREASSGHSRSAYFVGKILATIPRMTLSALHFTAFFVILATPRMPFGLLFATNFLYFYCIYGLGCCISMVTTRENGPLLAMIASLTVGVFSGYGPPLSTVKLWHLEWMWRMCPGTWFSEAYFDAHTTPMRYLYDVDEAAAWSGYTIGWMSLDLR
ncbi:hypothetical protein MMC25_001645 [Agyrium rufum]|nr:hypothetical protein [Agyrium rufum]